MRTRGPAFGFQVPVKAGRGEEYLSPLQGVTEGQEDS